MDLRSGILSTAQALGINPLDLATAISYETAGTFDPTKRGPTTQWGQHRGLIQFGEPQAQKYGVDWNNPIGSQLGPQGAVANYLRDTGVKPGMGLLDIYSAINAGGVGRYNRTDANNGGAPGTVREKVEQQMAGHRRKAAALLGTQDIADDTMAALGKPPIRPQGILSTSSPQTEAPMEEQKATGLLGSLFPNMTADRQDRLVMALSGLSMFPNEGIMQMAGQRMADRRDDRKEAKTQAAERQRANVTAQWLAQQPGGQQYAQAIASGALPASAALGMWQAASQGPEFRQITGEQAAAMGLDPTQVYNLGANGKVTGIGAGNTVIENNIGAGENAFQKKTGELLAQEAATVVEQGALAQRGLGQIERLGSLLETIPEGAGGAFTNVAARMGLKLDGASEVEAANAIISQLVPQQRPPGSGVMSDADLALFRQSLPQLINTREGNMLIVDTMRGIAEYDMKRGQIARALQLGQITQEQAAQAYEALGNPLQNFQASTPNQPRSGTLPAVPNFTEMTDEELDAYIQQMGGQ